MTIRYKCGKCGSVLKIKDELAGTDGKCPKCKTKFIVPEPGTDDESDADVAESATESVAATTPAKSPEPAKAPSVKPSGKAPSPGDDDFDPVAFLLDDTAPNAKKSAGLATPAAQAAPVKGPVVDSQGRRHIMAPPPSPAQQDASPAAKSAQAMMGGGAASANARDLLTKTMEDGRVKSAGLPEDASKPKFDFRGFVGMLIGLAPRIALVIVGAIGAYFLANWLMTDSLPLPKLAGVSGTVTLDGKPLTGIRINLSPVDSRGKSTTNRDIRLRDATAVTDGDGYFTAQYLPGVYGVPVGKVRIWLEPIKPEDFNKIPGPYSQPASPDIREVREAGNEGKFNLELKSTGG